MAKKEKASMVKKPFYKKWWFILIVVVIAISALGNLMGGNSKSDSEEKTEQSSSKKSSSKKVTKKLTIKLDHPTFETDATGKAKITGTTLAGAKVAIGYGIVGDNVTASKDGRFTLAQKLSDTDKTELDINATLDSKTASAKATITPSKEYITAEAKKNDITQLATEPTTEQAVILNDLANQQFTQQFPYKGSKIHSITGVIQNWTKDNTDWYYKATATIVNAYGAKRDATIEIKITPTAADSGNVAITAY